jgi:hypothetical protein
MKRERERKDEEEEEENYWNCLIDDKHNVR